MKVDKQKVNHVARVINSSSPHAGRTGVVTAAFKGRNIYLVQLRDSFEIHEFAPEEIEIVTSERAVTEDMIRQAASPAYGHISPGVFAAEKRIPLRAVKARLEAMEERGLVERMGNGKYRLRD